MHKDVTVLGYRKKNFAYQKDLNYKYEEEKKKLIGGEKIIMCALRIKPHISHQNLEQAVSLWEELGKPETYFTHMSHQIGKHKEVNKDLPEGTHLSYDQMKLIF